VNVRVPSITRPTIETGAKPVYVPEGDPLVVVPVVEVPVVEVPVVEVVVLPVVVPPLVVPVVVVEPPDDVLPLEVDVPVPEVVPSVVPEVVAVVVEPVVVDPDVVAVVVEPVVVPVVVPPLGPVVVPSGPDGIPELLSVNGPNRSGSPSRFNTKLPLVAFANVRLITC